MEKMGFWRSLGALFGGRRFLNVGETSAPYTGDVTSSGNSVTPENSLKISSVWACVRLRAETIASMPLHLRDKNGKILKNHGLYRILHESPNADMTAFEFWQVMITHLDLWGNAYAEIKRNKRNEIISLEILDASAMSVKRAENGELSYIYRKKQETTFKEANIFHLKGFSLDGIVGLSPIQYASMTIGAQKDADSAASHEFTNRLKSGGFLSTGERILSSEQREKLEKKLATFSRPENAGKYLILEAGMTLVSSGNTIRMNPADAQLLESRQFGIEEICRAFKTPPPLIGHTDKASSWASSFSGMNEAYLSYSINPLLVSIERAISKKLLNVSERVNVLPKFSPEGLLRIDSEKRAAFYATLLQNGVITRNEARGWENLPPVVGGDDLTVQVNLVPIQNLGKQNDIEKQRL